jgi:hypothetical protein
MVHQVNRGAEILKNWDRYQLGLENSIGDGMPDSGIKKEKYNFLVAGLARLSVQPSIDERIYSSMIAAMVKKLRKEIYPNLLLRTLVFLRERLFRIPKIRRELEKSKQENFIRLDKAVKNMGIDNISGYLADQLDHERSTVALSLVSRFHGDNSLELYLNIGKDGNGNYQLDNISASLFVPGEMSRQCLLDSRYRFTVEHIYNLLMGRAVMTSRNGSETTEKWVQIDFGRTDENGFYQLRENHVERGFELDQMLRSASVNIGYAGINNPEALKLLADGAQVLFKIEGLGVFSLEASPKHSELVFRDGKQQVIPVVDLKQKLTDYRLLANTVLPVINKLKTKRSLDQSSSLGL